MKVESTVNSASVPLDAPAGSGPDGLQLEGRFRALADTWKTQCAFMSSITDICMHPAYQEIIRMGQAVVPLLLRDLEQFPNQWFWALKAITGADPVPASSRGNMREMAEHWLRWGREHGYR